MQEGKAIAYASRLLNKAEKNYSITEREALAALWAMERFKYYLLGRKFKLVTDHKAMERIKSKKEFGSGRIARWFERFEQFDFIVEYRKGEEMKVPDALSRIYCIKSVKEGEKINMNKQILKIHEENSHRKDLRDKLEKIGISASEHIIRKIVNSCEICMRKDSKIGKSAKHVKTERPGEIVAMDIMEIKKGVKVIMAIDYFSRKLFAKLIKSKEARKCLNFIKEVHKYLKIEKLLTDHGKEFNNNKFEQWTKSENIKHEKVTPYYHQANGRIERANRTIRTALKKENGNLKERLKRVIKVYNDIRHRGIGMPPNEAMKHENYDKGKEIREKYEREFKEKNLEKFTIGQDVLVRNEKLGNKMIDKFNEEGVVINMVRDNDYLIRMKSNGRNLRRHASQLRGFSNRGEVGTNRVIGSETVTKL